jgi:hypothetical protein
MPWELTGNPGTVDTNFLGTTDARPLRIKTGATTPARGDVVHITAGSPGELGRVGIRWIDPRRALHVEQTEIHTGGTGAGYSFGNRESAFVELPGRGERWVWYATGGAARLWSGTDKLFVPPGGQLLLNGGVVGGIDLNVRFPEVPIGEVPFLPTTPPLPGELVLGGVRTSIRGFDSRTLQDPARPGGMRLGFHWIRTNGNDGELWMAFAREIVLGFQRSMHAAVPWFGPRFNTTSDARLKTNVRQLDGALDKLERIRGAAFEWAETESPHALGGEPGQPSIGVVAQEVEEVFPELVSIYNAEHEYKAVNYQGLTSVLIEAVKELKAQNEDLRSRIEALEGAQQ